MNERFALRILDKVMNWDTERATNEFQWLRLFANFKYDSYRDFIAGARFIESLADWLQQFEQSEREIAYRFLRQKLVFISAGEIQHLVHRMYPETIHRHLVAMVAKRLAIKPYKIWAHPEGETTYDLLKRKSLFVALSDGARIDILRRANAGRISNEQVVMAPQINITKWNSVLEKLRDELGDPQATFSSVFLIDDFIATGTTLLRLEDGEWDGKLKKFWEDTQPVIKACLAPDWSLCVHHFIGTFRASVEIVERQKAALIGKGESNWFTNVQFSYGMVLPENIPLVAPRDSPFLELTKKYYDPAIQSKHTELGGKDVRLGFGNSALPLVLEHNTPNNSVALLWADTNGGEGIPAMRPLFRRRQRHI